MLLLLLDRNFCKTNCYSTCCGLIRHNKVCVRGHSSKQVANCLKQYASGSVAETRPTKWFLHVKKSKIHSHSTCAIKEHCKKWPKFVANYSVETNGSSLDHPWEAVFSRALEDIPYSS